MEPALAGLGFKRCIAVIVPDLVGVPRVVLGDGAPGSHHPVDKARTHLWKPLLHEIGADLGNS